MYVHTIRRAPLVSLKQTRCCYTLQLAASQDFQSQKFATTSVFPENMIVECELLGSLNNFWESIEDNMLVPSVMEKAVVFAGIFRMPTRTYSDWASQLDTPDGPRKTVQKKEDFLSSKTRQQHIKRAFKDDTTG